MGSAVSGIAREAQRCQFFPQKVLYNYSIIGKYKFSRYLHQFQDFLMKLTGISAQPEGDLFMVTDFTLKAFMWKQYYEKLFLFFLVPNLLFS